THGPHHVAQNSTTYNLPGAKAGTAAPLTHLAMLRGGAAAPTASFCPVTAGASASDDRVSRPVASRVRFMSVLLGFCGSAHATGDRARVRPARRRGAATGWRGGCGRANCPRGA